jgi:hypothetical protein
METARGNCGFLDVSTILSKDSQLALIVGEPGLGKSRLIEESWSTAGRAAHLG